MTTIFTLCYAGVRVKLSVLAISPTKYTVCSLCITLHTNVSRFVYRHVFYEPFFTHWAGTEGCSIQVQPGVLKIGENIYYVVLVSGQLEYYLVC